MISYLSSLLSSSTSSSLSISSLLLLLLPLVYFFYSTRGTLLPQLPHRPHYPWISTFLSLVPIVRDGQLLPYIITCFNDLCPPGSKYGLNFTAGQPNSGPALLTADPITIEHILKGNFNNYEKGKIFNENLFELLGNGIFNADGDEWYTQRRTASHIFTMRQLKDQMSKSFLSHGIDCVITKLQKNMENNEKKSASDPYEYVDLHSLFYSFTLDSICEIAFSLDGVSPSEKASFGRSFDAASINCVHRFLDPLWKVKRMLAKIPGINRIPMVRNSKEFQTFHHIKVINEFAYNIVKKRREEVEIRRKEREERGEDFSNSDDDKGDLISLFLNHKDSNSSSSSSLFNDEYLRDLILNMAIAGRDTTAQNLSWCCALLFKNNDNVFVNESEQIQVDKTSILNKLYAEIDHHAALHHFSPDYSLLAHNPPSSPIYQSHLSSLLSNPLFSSPRSLLYLQSVLLETLRLFPSVPKDPKFAKEDDVIKGNGIKVVKGTIVLYCAHAMGRMAQLWESPRVFKPERWMEKGEGGGEGEEGEEESDKKENHTNRKNDAKSADSHSPSMKLKDVSPYHFPAFQGGLRVCLGRIVAMVETSIMMILILSKYKLVLKPGMNIKNLDSLTLPMADAFWVRVEERK